MWTPELMFNNMQIDRPAAPWLRQRALQSRKKDAAPLTVARVQDESGISPTLRVLFSLTCDPTLHAVRSDCRPYTRFKERGNPRAARSRARARLFVASSFYTVAAATRARNCCHSGRIGNRSDYGIRRTYAMTWDYCNSCNCS